ALGRKIKRVSDVNSMGYQPYDPSQGMQSNLYPNLGSESPAPNAYQQSTFLTKILPLLSQLFVDFPNQQFSPNQNYGAPPNNPQVYGFNQPGPYSNAPPTTSQFGGAVFGQPIVQDMAMQYGQQVCTI